MKLKLVTYVAFISTMHVVPTHAQETSPSNYFVERLPPLRASTSAGSLATGAYRETFIFRTMSEFRAAAGHDQVLQQDDVDRIRLTADAAYRSRVVQKIAENDINGDGSVTKEEVSQSWLTRSGTPIPEQLLLGFLTADLDQDGAISAEDAANYARQRQSDSQLRSGVNLPAGDRVISKEAVEHMLSLDPDGDGKLTADEFEGLSRAAFAHFDKNNDGILSGEEATAMPLMRPARIAGSANQGSACSFPAAKPPTRVTFVSGYESGTLSDVTVVGQDQETEVADLVVNRGDTPLQIYATAYTPMIWRISGAVERVEQFVTTKGGGDNGLYTGAVVGLPKDRVTFVPQGCIPSTRGDAKGVDAAASFGSIVGRKPTQVLTSYGLLKLARGGQEQLPATGGSDVAVKRHEPTALESYGAKVDEASYSSMLRFSPGGLAKTDPATVVGPSPAERYLVAPQEAGLLQLLAQGLISRTGSSYLIKSPIPRFPAGLNGAHGVTFVLGEGVPMPEGSPGHSTVMSHDGKELASPLRRAKPR